MKLVFIKTLNLNYQYRDSVVLPLLVVLIKQIPDRMSDFVVAYDYHRVISSFVRQAGFLANGTCLVIASLHNAVEQVSLS